MIYFL